MIPVPTTDASDGAPPSKPETSRGLADPRTIHPAPEGIFPDPVESSANSQSSESDAEAARENAASDDIERGVVDPRNDQSPPDL
jgi:hypothetical protein